jgi:predicted DNA-binding protein YlxM (UPF0122 family)
MDSKNIDWEAIQREYRAGILSVREIASIFHISHTAINKQVKKNPDYWKRDLTQRVKEEVSRKIVSDEVSNADEETIIKQASDRAIEVIRQHRTAITKLAEIEASFANELQGLSKKDKTEEGKPVALSTKVSTLLSLVTASEKRVKMERQAFGITDESKGDGDQITVIPIVFDGEA